jgi:Ca2+/H+ antiporter
MFSGVVVPMARTVAGPSARCAFLTSSTVTAAISLVLYVLAVYE